jgi:hypothetical protein
MKSLLNIKKNLETLIEKGHSDYDSPGRTELLDTSVLSVNRLSIIEFLKYVFTNLSKETQIGWTRWCLVSSQVISFPPNLYFLLDYDPGDTKVDPKNKHFYGG